MRRDAEERDALAARLRERDKKRTRQVSIDDGRQALYD
jgi:hypothetical protein